MISNRQNIILAAKCAPEEKIFSDIEKAGIRAIELYLSSKVIKQVERVIKLCKKFSFNFALHAPDDCLLSDSLLYLAGAIKAKVIVFHNIYWDDEWKEIIRCFKNAEAKLCVENTQGVHEPVKFMRRYNLGRCLDLEHLQMQCAGVFEEEFIKVIRQSSHIHLTGYVFGSKLWHTHIHHSPKHSLYMLNLLKKACYCGFLVSESRISLQNYKEFKELREFFHRWEKGASQ